MSRPERLITHLFSALLFLVPLIFLPSTSELFEFNKMIATYLLTTFIVAAWLARMIIAKRLIFRRTVLDLPLIIFLASQLLSLAFSIDPRTSWLGYYSRFNGGFLSLLSYSLLYWAAVSNLDQRSTTTCLKSLLVSAVGVTFWGFLERFGIDDAKWVQDVAHRVFSTLGQPNWLAAFLTAIAFIPLSLALTAPKPVSRWLYLGYSLFMFMVIVFTKSRSGLLAFGLSTAVYWGLLFFIPKKSLSISKFSTPLLVFAAGVAIFSLSIRNPIQDQLLRRPPAPPSETSAAAPAPALEIGGSNSAAIRKIVWAGAMDIWRSTPKTFWVGTGPETFAMAYYQHRPIEHNATSEWELLYNKAHNEFLNFLSTTGLLGLGSYLFLLASMAYAFIKSQIPNTNHQTNPNFQKPKGLSNLKIENYFGIDNWLLIFSLFAGWLSFSITNFWGFSVVITQILLFLFPAFALTLTTPSSATASTPPLTHSRLLALLPICLAAFWLIWIIGKYWRADVLYASGQKNFRAFSITQDVSYLVASYNDLSRAYLLNPDESPISSDLSLSVAYLALLSADVDPAASQSLVQTALSASAKAISDSPYHPNYYKSRFRTLLVLATSDPQYFAPAKEVLEAAARLAPTDPRVPYNQGILAKYQSNYPEAAAYFRKAQLLKPDFADASFQLSEIATLSAQPTP